MNPTVRKYLIIAAKHAVNAIMTNSALAAMLPQTFNLHNLVGILALLKATGAVVGAREAMVWGPKIFAWSQSITNGDDKSQGTAAGK